ncbi:MAG: hypothetical protein ACKVOP_04520 [Sphingomonadaceae bacterium]
MKISTEAAEAWPFTRVHIAELIEVPLRRLNNWIDRNDLWPEGRAAMQLGYYRVADVFDLAGFSALRIADVPERRAASFTRNFGFYRSFLSHGDQLAQFSYRNGAWDIGVYDPQSIISLVINMRSLGSEIFRRLGETLPPIVNGLPNEAFLQFRNYYLRLLELDRLDRGTATAFEDDRL